MVANGDRQLETAEAKLAGLRRVYKAIRREYGEAREQDASDTELAAIEELGAEVSARVKRGEEYISGLREEEN